MADFERLLGRLLGPRDGGGILPLLDPAPWLAGPVESEEQAVAALNGAFLLALCGAGREGHDRATSLLDRPPPAAPDGLAAFYRRGLDLIRGEIGEAEASDPDVAAGLRAADEGTAGEGDRQAISEALWSLFFPEGVGVLGHEEERIAELRTRRTVRLDALSPSPIADASREILFTSNVLLTVPSASADIDALPYPAAMHRQLQAAADEPQAHWYDHPIQVGVEPNANELLHGLRGLDEAVAFERRRDPRLGRVTVALSLSVTHPGLRQLAREYVRQELGRGDRLEHLDVHVFTEEDTRRLLDGVLVPAAGTAAAPLLGEAFGVDGEYGRHYSFLKAIAALWQVLIDPGLRATFKTDLDQVFPQDLLVAETGASAFEHLASPLWGARGVDHAGQPVELGMIAGALVNERDIGRGLFTPDVGFPDGPATADEHVFFSRLPQALSTRAEMMERYDSAERDGRRTCLERVHVTGGTNGILVAALRRHRPFTPSFIGRAEDQAYILSTLDGAADGSAPRLAYGHEAGLIMRHDREAFAGEAIAAARAGKLVGDDVRLLYFSAYADMLGRDRVKDLLDPFTGGFISRLPVTVALLRFALRLGQAIEKGDGALGRELAEVGVRRLGKALSFCQDRQGFRSAVGRERQAWARYYETLDRLEKGLASEDPRALALRRRAQGLVARTRLT